MTSTPGAVPADRTSRVLGGVALALISAGVLMIAVLHLVGPTAEISVVRRTISEYQLTTSAWAFNLGVVLLAVGSLVVIVALVRDRVAGPGGVILLLGWVAGLLTLAMYEKHNWATGPSGTGQVHRLASLVAFLCLPLSMMVISARGRRTGLPLAASRWVFVLGAIGLAWFLPIVAAMLLRPATGLPWWQAIPLGLVERGLALSEVAALVVLTVAMRPKPTAPDTALSGRVDPDMHAVDAQREQV